MTRPLAGLAKRTPPARRYLESAAAMLALGGIAYAAAGVTRRLVAEARRYRKASRVLYRRWTRIPAIVGTGTLRIHSRMRDVMTNADPIVLIHGYGVGSSYFVPLAARLSEHAPVFAPDLPGHGPSDRDARTLTIPELARALRAWMERMGLRRAVLVGHSLGCQVAIHAAAQDPELASRLVLIGPTADPAARTGLRQVLRGVRTGASERAGVTALGALDYARAGPDLVREEMELMVADSPEDLLPRLTCPVAIIRGERDRIVPQHWAERLARESGGPDPIVVPGWGHAVHYDAPATVAAAIVGLQIPSERERRAATFVPEARP